MEIRRIKITQEQVEKLLEGLYLTVFAFFTGYFFLLTTTFQLDFSEYFFYNVRMFIVVLTVVRLCLSGKSELRDIVIIFVLCVSFMMAWRRNGYEDLLNLMILILGAKGISIRKIMKVYVTTLSFLLALTIVSALTGNIENLVYYMDGRRVRNSFGIIYPTDFSAHIFYIVLGHCYLRGKRITYWEIGGIIGLAGLVYWFCDARLNTICLFMAAVCFFLYRWGAKRKIEDSVFGEIIISLCSLSTVLCAGVMIGLSVLYSPNNRLLVLLDTMLTSRLRLAKKGIEIFGFSLWGRYIRQIGMGGSATDKHYYFFLDSSYLSIILRYGVIIMGVILFFYLYICLRAKKQGDISLILVIALMSVQCMVEHHMLDIAYNPFILALLASEVCLEGDRKLRSRVKELLWKRGKLYEKSSK